MSEIQAVTRPLRDVRLRAGVPRALALLFVLVLCLAGVRTIVAPAKTVTVAKPAATPVLDQGAEAFAEAFTRAYLSWTPDDTTQRQSALQPFISTGLDQAGGLDANGSQSVLWSYVVGEQPSASQTLVTVAAQTSNGLMYLSVPVARDSHGFMFIPSYPALVGPPASNTSATVLAQQQVSDSSLQTVVARAVTNYLAGNQANLLADLTSSALVSLPPEHLTVTGTQQATWIVPNHSVAIQVQATDSHGNSWTLTYDVTVEKLDRWFVQLIQVDPTFQGG